MKRIICVIFVLSVLFLLFAGCGNEAAVSEDVKTVLEITCNTPNTDIFDPNCIYRSDMSDEDKAAYDQRWEVLDQNLEDLLGKYFSPGSFDLFLNSYLRSRFFIDDPTPSELTSISLVSYDDKCEVMNVQVTVGEDIVELTVTFRRNDDGLLYRVDAVEKTN